MKSLLLIFLTVFSLSSLAMPDQVILIRHGEEPTKGPEGTELSKKGRERAAALHEIFDNYPDLQTPSALFAAKPKNKHGSIRAIQTLGPLSKRLNMEVQIPYEPEEYHLLINRLKNDRALDGKTVLIAWGHHELEPFAEALGAKHVKPWNGEVFDKLWLLTFKDGEFISFEQRKQKLSADQKGNDKKDEKKDEKKPSDKRKDKSKD